VSPLASVAPDLLVRARADQVATLFARWHLTSISMALGALILCAVMWGDVDVNAMAVWVALIATNQAWRAALARAWRKARPGPAAATRWGRYWVAGSMLAGALWGAAGWYAFPVSPQREALLVVCLFGVVLGGLNLTAVYRPAFYGFALPALVPLIVRVAWVGDTVHLYTAGVIAVVLAFVLGFGHRLNDVLTQSLAMRYENVDLIGELRERTRAAHDAKSAAEHANHAKSQLLAAASHDLRQPLHALGLYVSALAARASGTEWRNLVGSVQTAAETLDTQFAQLLDLSQLEAGALAPARQTVSLMPLFVRLATELAPQVAARGLSFRIVRTRLAVDSDPDMLTRILRNLVANAVRYTREGGVVIGARRRGGRVAVEVVDTGIGIHARHVARIFDDFYQVRGRTGASHADGGMGLGLSIVRGLTNLLQHEVCVASRPGAGSRFTVVAPRASPPLLRIDRAAGFPVRAPVRSALAGRFVAVIDDDTAAVHALEILFETWGARAAGGADAGDVLAACGEVRRYPDLIVADLRLRDGVCGVDEVMRVREEFGLEIPALIVSGDMTADAALLVRAAGLSLLPKPVVSGVLEAAACRLVESHVPSRAGLH